MMRGRRFDIVALSAARTAGKTFLLLEAGGSNPLIIQQSRMAAGSLATSFQLEAKWVKVNVKGSPTEHTAAVVHPLDPGGTAFAGTVLADINADVTSYLSDPEFIRGHSVWPSTIGWRYGSVRDEDMDEWIYIAPGELWGLKMINASISSTTVLSTARVIELL